MNVSLQNIMNQVTRNDLETTIFTNQLGGNSGTRGKGCGLCLRHIWDWLTCSGISYDKNSVTRRINEAFRGASSGDMAELKGSLETFKTCLQAMENKFSKKGTLREDLTQTIRKVDSYLTRARGGGQMNYGASAARAVTRRPRTNRRVRKQAEAQQAKGNREALIRSVAAEAKPKYCQEIVTCYGSDSQYIGIAMKWVEDTYAEIHQSLGKDIKKPLNPDEIRIQFEAIMGQKILAYNEKKLETAIPDFFTNDAYGLKQVSDWLPGNSEEKHLGQFMTTIPFSNAAIKHIQVKANDSHLINISTQQGIKYCHAVETCYGRDSRYIGKVMKWVDDTYAEIHQSLGKEIEKPLNPDEIRIQFETIMGQKNTCTQFQNT